MANKKNIALVENLLYVWKKIKKLLNGKVDKVDGKGLSTNDFTTEEKEKLASLSGSYTDLTDKPVFRYTAPQSFTLVNYDNIQEGVHILPYGAQVYYGNGSFSTSTDYMVSTGAGSVVIFTKNSTGQTVYFKAFTNKEVITGATGSSSCVSRTIKFADGTSDLNKILKVTKATNNSSKIKTEATWVTPDVPNNGTLTIKKNGTTVATFGANSSSNITADISVPEVDTVLNNESSNPISNGTVTVALAGKAPSYQPLKSASFTFADNRLYLTLKNQVDEAIAEPSVSLEGIEPEELTDSEIDNILAS